MMTPELFTYQFLRLNPMNNTERIKFLLKHDKDFAFEHAVMGEEWAQAMDGDELFNRVRRVVLTWVKDVPPIYSPTL